MFFSRSTIPWWFVPPASPWVSEAVSPDVRQVGTDALGTAACATPTAATLITAAAVSGRAMRHAIRVGRRSTRMFSPVCQPVASVPPSDDPVSVFSYFAMFFASLAS